jgi:glycosyltransferase involved in cell wall biosynthesis
MPLLSYPQIELEITDLELEWQDPEGDDRERVLEFLGSMEERVRPDLVHLNGYREACAAWRAPVLVTAHSCVGSWWRACRGCAPSEAGWQSYLDDVAVGLASADRWVAPTAAFRSMIEQLYAPPRKGEVIWNGLASLETEMVVAADKEPFILAAGRLWDEAKNVAVLSRIADGLDWPVRIAGARRQEGSAAGMDGRVEWLGKLPNPDLLAMMRRAGIFVSPAVYEPFGLTVLEAAASGCALVLADIPVFRELWDEAALFVDPRDGEQVAAALNSVSRDPSLRTKLQSAALERASRYTLAAKADGYEQLYRDMLAHADRPALPLGASFLGVWA